MNRQGIDIAKLIMGGLAVALIAMTISTLLAAFYLHIGWIAFRGLAQALVLAYWISLILFANRFPRVSAVASVALVIYSGIGFIPWSMQMNSPPQSPFPNLWRGFDALWFFQALSPLIWATAATLAGGLLCQMVAKRRMNNQNLLDGTQTNNANKS
ncbi:MAG: hypothetical protein LBH13_07510 [Cellulomonadaceae bacterium]|jgi:hypothetical protein|nr:hypothetical protein [Cellulomonadaceae bacterium]